jgi:putative sterol carrier protein
MKIFTDEWAKEYAGKINPNKEYQEAAEGWIWPMVFTSIENDVQKSIYLDLENGTCKSARPATEDDLLKAEFIISASAETWKEILNKKLDPMMAVMVKKLELKKGNVSSLLQYVNAAKELINSATQVETDF